MRFRCIEVLQFIYILLPRTLLYRGSSSLYRGFTDYSAQIQWLSPSLYRNVTVNILFLNAILVLFLFFISLFSLSSLSFYPENLYLQLARNLSITLYRCGTHFNLSNYYYYYYYCHYYYYYCHCYYWRSSKLCSLNPFYSLFTATFEIIPTFPRRYTLFSSNRRQWNVQPLRSKNSNFLCT